MALGKTDKIIAVVAVIILIVAAIGIYMYLTQEKEEGPKPPEEKYYKYKVVVNVLSKNETREGVVKDKIIGNDTVIETIDVPVDIAYRLRNMSVYVEYKDKKCGLFGFGRIMKGLGRDTLSVSLLDSEGKEISSGTIGGREGTENLTLETTAFSSLDIDIIEAKSLSEAQRMLDENITTDLTNVTYQIQLKLDQKEGILRPLMWLLEKLEKDEYRITVTYYYYDYSLEEIGPKEGYSSENQYKEEGLKSSDILSKAYSILGYPGKN